MSLHGSSQAPRDRLVLESKHAVYLSHSGAQKGFVEQLDLDLRKRDRYPFFDQDRNSLPIGVRFPPLIFKAIQQCQVGVVILSEEFLSSKWPMLELVEMVRSDKKKPDQMKIVPIFLSISCADLANENKLRVWKAKWEELAKDDIRISIPEWEAALKSLEAQNGLVFNLGVGEVKFREEIVKEICKIVRPFHRWDDSHVQGRSRLSQIIHEKIKETPISSIYGIHVVGLYGVGGIGKTTACKSLCNDFDEEFGGRVCHVEFGNGTEMELLHKILKNLSSTRVELLKELSEDQRGACLKKVLQFEKVFLAIDNVSSNFKIINEARRYLQTGYGRDSIVLVTARSLGQLENLRLTPNECLPMPELERDEARALFLYHIAPRVGVDEAIVIECIQRCYFSLGDGNRHHYHPLALEVLGKQLGPCDPKEWWLQLKEVDTFNKLRELQNPVFSILRTSYDALLPEDKLLFMDVAIYHSNDMLDSDYLCCPKYGLEDGAYWSIFEWLSVVHGLNRGIVKSRLNDLKKKSLLEELGDGSSRVGMHDLWREFAVMETKAGEIENRRWIYEFVNVGGNESDLSSGGWRNLLRICIVGRLESSCVVRCINLNYCSNVTVLRLGDLDLVDSVLDLSELKQLKILEVFSPETSLKVRGIRKLINLKVLIWIVFEEFLSTVKEISYLKNLQVLQLSCINLKGSFPLDFDDEDFRFGFDDKDINLESDDENIALGSNDEDILLNLSGLRSLQVALFHFPWDFTLSGFSILVKNLQILTFRQCPDLSSCPEVGDVLGLNVLVLDNCSMLKEMPNLQKLTKLRILDISGCASLTTVAGLGSLVALQELLVRYCHELQALPDVSTLINLQKLDVKGCDLLTYIPGMGNLIALEEFNGSGQFLEDLCDRGIPTKLHILEIPGWRVFQLGHDDESYSKELQLDLPILESVLKLILWKINLLALDLCKLTSLQFLKIFGSKFSIMSGLSNLITLKNLDLVLCDLKRLPDMGKHMRLESLSIRGCKKLEGWDGVGKLEWSNSQIGADLHCNWTLLHLEELHWKMSAVVELPDLSHFPALKKLWLEGGNDIGSNIPNFALHCEADHLHFEMLICSNWPIIELPDLKKFPSLKTLNLIECDKLTSLTSSGPLTALEDLHLRRCKRLQQLPDVDFLPRLRDFDVEECGVTLNAQVVENLRARRACFHVDRSSCEFNPGSLDNESIPDNESIIDSEPNGELTLFWPKRLMEQDMIGIKDDSKRHCT